MYIFVYGLIFAVLVLLFIFSIKLTAGKVRVLTTAVNLLLSAVIGGSVLAGVLNHSRLIKESEKHTSSEGIEFLDSITYLRTEDGYNIFSKSQIMSPAAIFAVPESDAPLPSVTKLYGEVAVFSGNYTPGQERSFSDGRHPVRQNVELITPNFRLFALLASVISAALLLIFDTVLIIITLHRRKASEQQQ